MNVQLAHWHIIHINTLNITMRKIFTILLFILGIIFYSNAQTVPVTLKVVDKTKGLFSEGDKKVFSWVAMWDPSYVEYKNSGSWYSNFFEGYTGGSLVKTATEWTWSYTFNAQKGGKFSWNPNVGTPGGAATEITSNYGLRDKGKNVDFFVSSAGAISGETMIIFTPEYIALADKDGNITKKITFTFDITLKVIDKTKGEVTGSSVFSKIPNQTNPYEVITNSYNGWNFFNPPFTNATLTQNTYEWIYSYTFKATPNNTYSWSPAIGTATTPQYLFEKYGINEDFSFSINQTKNITGKTTLVILSANQAILINPADEIDYLGDLVDHSNNDCLHAFGRWIIDGNGDKVQLRGIGLGNYMLVEPYMWGINNAQTRKSDTQQAILSSLATLTGWDNVNAFMDEYRKNYITEADVKLIKESGFNSIRLPMHYNLFIETNANNNNFIEKGFTMINELLEWCKKYEVYLILDMHAVPGGQSTDKAISDQYAPGLWDGDSNGTATQHQTKLITLWKEVARRYANEKWIGGYDLINEIMYYPSRGLSSEIRSLYQRITTAIREVDTKHMLFIEGNGYANDHAGLTPAWDNNIAYSFHRYWCNNSKADIQYMLDLRDSNNVPIWMGESGENSNTWFTNSIELLENNHVGWAWWAYKKVSNISGTVSIPRPAGWDKILSYLQSATDNSASLGLDATTVKNTLMALAENTKLENAKVNKDVVYAMNQQLYNNDTKPYGDNIIPGKIYATEYDLGRNGFAYNETGILSRESSSAGAYNDGWVGRNDAVDMESCNDAGSNGFNVGWTNQGEWMNYTVNASNAGKYRVSIRYAVSGTGNITIKLNENPALQNIALENTNAWNTFKTKVLGEIDMPSGTNVIQMYINAGFNVSYLQFEYLGPTAIKDYSADSSFFFNGIYPNPVISNANFHFTLNESADKITFSIFDATGRLADEKIVNNLNSGINSFNYQNILPAGIYQNIMQVERDGKIIYQSSQKMISKK